METPRIEMAPELAAGRRSDALNQAIQWWTHGVGAP